ncbi:hypothetical protein ACTODO_00514 [Schaalia dentiphila ATCC 17982]|nr:hypothetical protein ACTODO_00514 [Schaalia odontolytica ATCC 17982]
MSGRGSSPLTRGKPASQFTTPPTCRLIPAHAGKTGTHWGESSGPRAHPRSRGENGPGMPSISRPPGSSPLTRGKRARSPTGSRSKGLIPAHAGKTAEVCAGALPGPAHPRSRGENLEDSLDSAGGLGSSPLTRGKPTRMPGELSRWRLIPAHAGKTSSLPCTG